MNRLIIGIAGKDGVGKSTLANWLVERHGFQKESFAKPFKAMLRVMGVRKKFVYDEKDTNIPGLGCTARFLERTLAQNWGRETIDDHVWIYSFARRIAAKGPPIVIDDVRFDAEAKYIKRVGGFVVELRREGYYDNALKRFVYGLFRLRHVSNRGLSSQYIDQPIWASTPEEARNQMQDQLRGILECRRKQTKANGSNIVRS